MNAVHLTVLDQDHRIQGRVEDLELERIVGALAADPETLDELRRAVERYYPHAHGPGPLALFEEESPEDTSEANGGESSRAVIDLAGRVLACHNCETTFAHYGQATVVRPDGLAPVPWNLDPEWLIVDTHEQLEQLLADRRATRLAEPDLDVRPVFYQTACGVLAESVLARAAEFRDADEFQLQQLVRDVHVQWLMTPRDDLGGRTPREFLVGPRHHHLMMDFQNQQYLWTLRGCQPPSVARETRAYQYGGIGGHEQVLYYEFIRELLRVAARRIRDGQWSPIDAEQAAQQLQQAAQDWLHSPQHDCRGQTPAALIDRERRRVPESLSDHDEVLDDNCPLCQMAAEGHFGPGFWNLDGSNMDDDFAFSSYETLEEWEAAERKYERWTAEFEARRIADARFISGESTVGEFLGVDPQQSRIWQCSYSNDELLTELPPTEQVVMRLFGIAAHLAELGEDLGPESEVARNLRAQFADFRRALDDSNVWRAESCAADFCENLEQLAQAQPELAAKCQDLSRLADRLLELCKLASGEE